MNRFAELCEILESTTKTREKTAALISYFQDAPPEDAMWAIRLLRGWKPPRVATSQDLRAWAREVLDIPEWLFEESCHAVGDVLETLALICPVSKHHDQAPLHVWIPQRLLPLHDAAPDARQATVIIAWEQMDTSSRFIWNKLLTGGFRPHVSEKTLIQALSVWRGLPETALACRLHNAWEPTAADYRALFSHDIANLGGSQPYPFHPLAAFDVDRHLSESRSEWQAFWHRKGLRIQLVKRHHTVFLWSEEQTLVNAAFPELCAAMLTYPDGTVFKGTITTLKHGALLPVAELDRRLKRKHVTKKLMQDVPVQCWVDDLLEEHGTDLRPQDFRQRLERVQALLAEADSPIQAAMPVRSASWEQLAALRNEARQHGADGLLLKRLTSPYCSNQPQDQWLLWKSEPFTVTVVLLYIQYQDTSAGTHTLEGTFGVWNGEHLVPVAKASSGFSDQDVYDIEMFVKDHTLDRFGPVRRLTPELVFTLAFDDVYPSSRHKSGLILHNPRIVCRQREQSIQAADTIATIQTHIF